MPSTAIARAAEHHGAIALLVIGAGVEYPKAGPEWTWPRTMKFDGDGDCLIPCLLLSDDASKMLWELEGKLTRGGFEFWVELSMPQGQAQPVGLDLEFQLDKVACETKPKSLERSILSAELVLQLQTVLEIEPGIEIIVTEIDQDSKQTADVRVQVSLTAEVGNSVSPLAATVNKLRALYDDESSELYSNDTYRALVRTSLPKGNLGLRFEENYPENFDGTGEADRTFRPSSY